MDFCPKCRTRLISLKKMEGKKVALLLSCPKCNYEKRATRPTTTQSKVTPRPSEEQIVIIGKWEQKLRTLPKVKMECPQCGNRFVYAWSVHIRRLEDSSTQFFRCTKCSYTFRETS